MAQFRYLDRPDYPGPPGPWWGFVRGHILIKTPCGMMGDLGNHTIANDGTVTPSVLVKGGEEVYHCYIKLLDWRPDEADRARTAVSEKAD